jgi:hypothetical protein
MNAGVLAAEAPGVVRSAAVRRELVEHGGGVGIHTWWSAPPSSL